MRQRPEYLMWMCCFLAGGMAGAGVGMLIAPQSGRDTRGRVGRRLRHAARSARDLRRRIADPDPASAHDAQPSS